MESVKSELLFDTLSNAAENVYVFENDMLTNHSNWSENAVSYFALPDDYHTNILEEWVERIYPEDRQAYVNDINALMTGRKEKHRVQYRVKNRYGDYVWVECNGNVGRDKDGTPKLFAGIITRLDNQSKYDPLTKKLTSHQFYLRDDGEPLTALLFGMDKFRRVIHNYGYQVGNEMLIALSNALDRPALGQSVYRMTGDEFLMVLPVMSEDVLQAYFQEVLQDFQAFCGTHHYMKTISFSGAGATYDPRSMDKEMLTKRLEHTMEQAKSFGGGQLAFFTKEIEERHKRIHEIDLALDESIANNFEGFAVYYQPVLCVGDNKLRSVEALLRFHSKTLGWISPAEFIPILENNRSIIPVGLWVMEQVIRQNKEWNEKYGDIGTAFNVSYLQLYNDELINRMIQLVKEYKVNPKSIVVELTESCKVEHPESLSAMFTRLINQGFNVALDDFGMENSTLTLLRDTPITTVKIDHSFVRTIVGDGSEQDNANLAIVSGIITMCKKLSHHIVVEGIETPEIAEMMKKLGADFLQGYYYSKPMPAKEAEELFAK